MRMKDLLRRWHLKKWPLKWMALGLACVLAAGILVPVIRATRAGPAPASIFNHPYSAPSPPPPVFGPDQAAWDMYQDHPGYDRAYTAARSRTYTGDTTPNHIYIGSNTLVFQGYDEDKNLDYIFTERYTTGFSSISFSLRPLDLSFHALGQSGFLFGGSEAGGLYTGYMIALEAREDELTGERVADLRLYSVEDADLNDPDAFADLAARTLVSTYAIGISQATKWPVYVRVEQDATGNYQVYIDGQLRTNNLPPLDSLSPDHGFGFYTSYIEHNCLNGTCNTLTCMAYANMRIEAPWVSVPATATVRFMDITGGLPGVALADPQPQTGQTGQNYYITPPGFSGYSLVEVSQKCLDPILYFALSPYNETTLYYVAKTACYKEATYENLQNNGTAEKPVDVETGHQIDYRIHAGGNGTLYQGNFVVNTVGQSVITMSSFPRTSDGKTHAEVNVGITSSQQKQDVLIGNTSTSIDGKMTVESNYPLQVGEVSSSQGQSRIPNDGILVGFQIAATANPPVKFLASGTNALAYSPACTTNGTNHQHSIPDNNNMSNLTTNAGLRRADERYIKVTYNQLRNDAGYQIDFLLGAWGNAKLNDYIYAIIDGLNSRGEPVTITVYRPTNLWSTNNNGNSINGTPIASMMPNPNGTEYVDPYDGQPYVYPKDGKISLTVERMHNTRHDYNIYLGAGQMNMRARETVLRIIDELPAGVTYVPGSSGVYEGNLVITTLPDGRQRLVWEFGVVPPDGYDIDFKVNITGSGLFENNALVDYSAPCPLPDQNTNNTYHMTGMSKVTEYFLDYNNQLVNLKPDRTIHMPLGEDYTTSVVSQSEILYNSDTYKLVGYRIIPPGQPGGSGPIIMVEDVPIPTPTIPNVTSEREIELFFAKNPSVTVEFRRMVDGVEIKDSVNFPVTFGDPFFLPDSVRASIEYPASSGQIYNYAAYVKTEEGVMPSPVVYNNGMPDKPIYKSVTEDETVIVYFMLQYAVTVHYVEWGNPSNTLKNDDIYLVDPVTNEFLVAPVTPPVLAAGGKRYMYEGYSLPGGPFIEGMPPTSTVFTGVNANKEITLYYSTTYNITVKWHEDLPYYDGRVYDELMPVQTFTFRAGELPEPFTMTAVTQIAYNGALYNHTGQFKWTSDAEQARPDPPDLPAVTVTLNEVHGDYTIIFLYTKQSAQQMHNIVVMFREYGNTANVLAPDLNLVKAPGANFSLSELLPFDYTAIPDWTYYAFEVDRISIIPGTPSPDPIFSNIHANHIIILQYMPEGTVLERFRELDNIPNVLAPDQTIVLPPASPIYSPKDWIPPEEIYVDEGHIYAYYGYQINDGPIDTGPYTNIPRPMPGVVMDDTITYLYINIALYIVTEEFRLWDDPWADPPVELAADNKVPVVPDTDFEPGVTEKSTVPLPYYLYNGRLYYYAGYALNHGTKVTGNAPSVPFPAVDRNGYIITYLYRALDLHVRQVVLLDDGTEYEVEWPLMGYLELTHDSTGVPATCISGRDGTAVKYSDYAIPFDIQDFDYLFRLIVPQNYTFEGHKATDEDVAHDPALRDLPSAIPNGEISINFSDSGEWWVTLYIKPAEPPGDHNSSYATNIFGSMVPPPPPPP